MVEINKKKMSADIGEDTEKGEHFFNALGSGNQYNGSSRSWE